MYSGTSQDDNTYTITHPTTYQHLFFVIHDIKAHYYFSDL
jgi:hypothetical protein